MKGSVAIFPCEWDEKEFGSRPFVTVALVSRNLDLWSECESDKNQRNCIEFKWTGLQVRIKWSPYFKAGVQIYSDLWSLLVGTKPKYFWQSKDFFRSISSYESLLKLFDLTVGRWKSSSSSLLLCEAFFRTTLYKVSMKIVYCMQCSMDHTAIVFSKYQ